MIYTQELCSALTGKYGSPLYLFDEAAFTANYRKLEQTFQAIYPRYRIAYSYKTNYTPYICRLVKQLGGFAEVVSEMEYRAAKRIGYADSEILFNGPDKGAFGVEAFLLGARIHADSLSELERLCQAAQAHPEENYTVSIRVNLDLGQYFISRFGMDESQLPEAFAMAAAVPNLRVTGLHCHISRCRGLEAWQERAEYMLALADRYFPEPPEYIDLGSGMFGSMAPSFALQFSDVPTYAEYAEAVAGQFAEHYRELPEERKPLLITEPGTTLVNRFVDFIAQVNTLKTIRGKDFAVLNCSEHNLGETCLLKKLPMEIIPVAKNRAHYDSIDFSGYTCLEQDIFYTDYRGTLGVGDYAVFGNVGGYSNVLKPPFIRENCAMAAIREDGETVLMKRAETFEDLFQTYCF